MLPAQTELWHLQVSSAHLLQTARRTSPNLSHANLSLQCISAHCSPMRRLTWRLFIARISAPPRYLMSCYLVARLLCPTLKLLPNTPNVNAIAAGCAIWKPQLQARERPITRASFVSAFVCLCELSHIGWAGFFIVSARLQPTSIRNENLHHTRLSCSARCIKWRRSPIWMVL